MDWQKKVSLWWAKNFRPLVVALLVGCGVHYTIYANQLGNFDAVHIGALYTADGWPEHLYWETQQGRWALRLVDMLRGGINQPALSALLMLFLYALAGVLLTDLFAVRSRVAKYLIPLTLVCAPYVAEVETYHYCSVSYALSFLLAVLAVRSAVCGVRFVWLMGTVCLAFALGMYQANLGTAAGLCVMLLLLAVLRRPGEWQAGGLPLWKPGSTPTVPALPPCCRAWSSPALSRAKLSPKTPGSKAWFRPRKAANAPPPSTSAFRILSMTCKTGSARRNWKLSRAPCTS